MLLFFSPLALPIAILVGYLIGSLPFGYLVAKAKGVNIFEVGSKSPGATNVRRVLGRGPGNLVFFLDAIKGVAATTWLIPIYKNVIEYWQGDTGDTSDPSIWPFPDPESHGFQIFSQIAVICLIGALLGHSFSCFTKFRGGKGVATTAGGFLVLMPVPLMISVAVWGVSFYASRYVSLASILAAIALPVAALFLGQPPLLTGFAAVIGAFVILRHRANIVRLLNGTENKFVKKPAPPQPPPSA